MLLGPNEGLGAVVAFFAKGVFSDMSLSVEFLAGVAGVTLSGWAVEVEAIEKGKRKGEGANTWWPLKAKSAQIAWADRADGRSLLSSPKASMYKCNTRGSTKYITVSCHIKYQWILEW